MIIDNNNNNNNNNNDSNLTLLALASANPVPRSMTLSASDLTPQTRGRGRTRRPLTPTMNRRRKTALDWKNTLMTPESSETVTTTKDERTKHNFKITINNKDINAVEDQNTGNVFSRKRAISF